MNFNFCSKLVFKRADGKQLEKGWFFFEKNLNNFKRKSQTADF